MLQWLSLLSFLGIAAAVENDYECVMIPGRLKQIDAGAGEVWGVNDSGDVFHWVNNAWINVPGKLFHVSVGPAGVWGVNSTSNLLKSQDYGWFSVAGSLKQVDAGGNKFLMGLDALGNVFCLRKACTMSRSSAVTFKQVDAELKYLSCGPFGCWGVNKGNGLYLIKGVTPADCQTAGLERVEGSLNMVEVGTDGTVVGVDADGNVFKREGITSATPLGTSWIQLDFCATFKHVTYDNGYLWLLNPSGEIYKCAESKRYSPGRTIV